MSEVLTPIVTQLGIGAVGGFIVGYALKKIAKILVLIIGLAILALIILVNKGLITPDYQKLEDGISTALGGAQTAAGWLAPIIAHLPFAGSFGLGLFLGFKLG